MGLTAGPVPPRVAAPAKAGLLALVDHARGAHWSTIRSCRLLGLDPDRAAGWRARREVDRLADMASAGGAVHGLLEAGRPRSSTCSRPGAASTGPTASWRRVAPGFNWCTCPPRRCVGFWPPKALSCKDRRLVTLMALISNSADLLTEIP